MTIFYLIRHGEPDWNFKDERKLLGAMRDFVPLTAKGVAQAEQVVTNSPWLQDCELILSSPYTRSLQTAAIMNRNLGKELHVEFDLHEWTPDNWQAATLQEITDLWRDYMEHNGCCPPGETRLWETRESLTDRIGGVLNKYVNKSKVIVVCHGMVIATLLGFVSDHVKFCGVYEYEILDG